MDHVRTILERYGLRGAASLPRVADGDRLGEPSFALKKRPNGKWAIFEGWRYLQSCKTRDLAEAETALKVFLLQRKAKEEGIVDVRRSDVAAILDALLGGLPEENARLVKDYGHRVRRVRPYVAGLRLFELDQKKVNALAERMLERYARSTVQASWQVMITAIRAWCRGNCVPITVPFRLPFRAAGRERVVTPEERDIVLRWALGRENYDPATGVWTPVGRLPKFERHRRRMVGRAMELGMPTGTRPGRLEGLAWKPHAEHGHIDLATGTLHRLPPGAPKTGRKAAPAVALPPALLATVRRWAAEDRGQTHVLRTSRGGPLTRELGPMFSAAMTELGIKGVTLHTLRHTCITRLIEAGVPASVISSVVGISLQVLRERYNHSDELMVQPMAHAPMDRILN